MSKEKDVNALDRRSFLKGAAAAGAAVAAGTKIAAAAEPAAESAKPAAKPAAKLPSETFITRPGSDFMTDVLKAVGLQYIAINPAAGFRSLHESIVNYAGNKNPEILTCLHEESAAASRTAMPKRRASRWASCCTAPSACSTARWAFTTHGAIACR